MNAFVSSVSLTTIEWLLCLSTLSVILRRDKESQFRLLAVLLEARVAFGVLLYPLLIFGGHGIEAHVAYKLYFFTYWTGFAMEAILSLLVIYSLFNLAMAPLDGIKDLGELVFRWVAVVSIVLTLAVMFIPHPSGTAYATGLLTYLQRAQAVMTLCLLLFVCMAIRPLGLTFNSRPFGVVLGLGLLAVSNLISSGWLAYFKLLHSSINVVNSVATSAALLLWTVYFLYPEPKRRIVVLPTTSPYLHWNRVAEVLGDPPGFVAIAGVPPEVFAPAEVEVMRRASLKMAPTSFPLMHQQVEQASTA